MKHSIIKIAAFLICLLTLSQGILHAQLETNKNRQKKYNQILSKADIAYQDSKFAVAADYYENYLKNPMNSNQEVQIMLADCYWQMRDYLNAMRVYKLLYSEVNQVTNQDVILRIAELYARNRQYSQAADWLKTVSGYRMKANVYNEKESINTMKKDSLDWKLGFLNINTSFRDFSPFLANNTLFFSSNKPLPTKKKAYGWDGNNFAHLWEIPVSSIDSNSLFQTDSALNIKHPNVKTKRLAGIYELGDTKSMKKAYRLLISERYIKGDLNPAGKPVKGLDKISFNAGAISVDRNNHFYFSANYAKTDRKGINRICLMEGLYSSSGITEVHKLPFGDANSFSVMHPAINSDGTLLVCSSNKKSGKVSYDLYFSKRRDITQTWDTLTAFSNNVNTIGNEVFPSITPNGDLYFSSDNIPGLGGLDIYRISVSDAMAGTGEVEHLGYPLNSPADDFGWTQQDSTGIKGFFTSDRLNCDDNLYSFSYNPVITSKIPKKSFVEGFVLEKQSLNPIKGATLFLYNVLEDTVYIAKADKNGKYRFPVLTSSDIIIKAVDKKYLNDCLSTNIVYEPQPKDTLQNAPRELLLDKFKVGFVWKLSNIRYDFDKFNIRADAMPILDSLIMVLKEQPITVELGSHTDSRGSIKYNERLSQQRAESAVAYLIAHGIEAKRIKAKGYGESQLLNRCSDGIPCSDEEHQANRRTEVKVTGYTTPQKVTDNINPDKFKDGAVINKSLLPKNFFDSCK